MTGKPDDQFLIEWHDRAPGQHATVPFNRKFPYGFQADLTKGFLPACQTKVEWPSPGIGWWEVRCKLCKASAALTTAGRVDDPTGVRLPCKLQGTA